MPLEPSVALHVFAATLQLNSMIVTASAERRRWRRRQRKDSGAASVLAPRTSSAASVVATTCALHVLLSSAAAGSSCLGSGGCSAYAFHHFPLLMHQHRGPVNCNLGRRLAPMPVPSSRRRLHAAPNNINTMLKSKITDADAAAKAARDKAEEELPRAQVGDASSSSSISSNSYPPVPSLRECLSFMLPALGIYAAPSLMSLIDAAFVGRTSSVELAALGPASSISDSASLPLLFISIAATNLIAGATSKGNADESRRVTRACLGLGTIGGTIIALAVFFKRLWLSSVYCGEPLMGGAAAASAAASATATLTPHCSSYTAIRTLGLPAVVVASIAQAVCIGTKDTRTPMVAVLLAAALNLVGDFIMVSGLGLGIAGAAWATTFSQMCAAGLLLRVLAKRGLLRGRGDSQELSAPVLTNVAETAEDGKATVYCQGSTRETISSILSFVPFLFVMSIKILMHNSAAATAASLGGAPAAAHTALFAVAMLCFTFGDTGSSLTQAFLPAFASTGCEIDPDNPGSSKGRRKMPVTFDVEAAKPTIARLLKCTLGVSTTVIAISSAMLTIFASQITKDAAVMYQMRRALPFMIGTLSLHGTAVALEGLLLAQQNFRALTATYSALAITIAAAMGYVRTSGVGLLGVWATYVWFQASRVVAFSVFAGLLPTTGFKQLWRRTFSSGDVRVHVERA